MVAMWECAECGFGCVVCPGREVCGEGAGGVPGGGILRTRDDRVAERAGELLLAGTAVGVALPGVASGLVRLLEPGAPPPGRRLVALARLRRAGVPAGLVLGPVLPGINDRLGDLEAAAQEAMRVRALWMEVRPARVPGRARAAVEAFMSRQGAAPAPRRRRVFDDDGAPPVAWERRLAAMAAAVRVRAGLAGGPEEATLEAHQLGLPFLRAGIGYLPLSGTSWRP